MQELIEKLKAKLSDLPYKDVSFAQSLIGDFKKYGKLTVNQEPWVQKLIDRATNKPPAPKKEIEVGTFSNVIALFDKAGKKLKYPKVRLTCEGVSVDLYRAGLKSKYAGAILVVGEGKFPNRPWYGTVTPSGVWEVGKSVKPEMEAALQVLLLKFGQNPARVAKEYGKLTGNCCFCNSALTDPHSTAAGFGPTCAAHYGLTAEWLKAGLPGEFETPTTGEATLHTGSEGKWQPLGDVQKIKILPPANEVAGIHYQPPTPLPQPTGMDALKALELVNKFHAKFPSCFKSTPASVSYSPVTKTAMVILDSGASIMFTHETLEHLGWLSQEEWIGLSQECWAKAELSEKLSLIAVGSGVKHPQKFPLDIKTPGSFASQELVEVKAESRCYLCNEVADGPTYYGQPLCKSCSSVVAK